MIAPRCLLAFVGVYGLAAGTAAGFATPSVFNPSTDLEPEMIGVDHGNTQTFTKELKKVIGVDEFGDPIRQEVIWFKYTSDGQSHAVFDLFGSSFGSSGSGIVLGTRNQGMIAVFDTDGELMGLSEGTRDDAGDPIPMWPTFSDTRYEPFFNTTTQQWVAFPKDVQTQGLAEITFTPDAPRNPHWDADPNDPEPFISPGGQDYSPKNEYEVWETSLEDARNGQGWRNGDRARYGPGARWDQYDALPEGDYYIAITASGTTFHGDTARNEMAMNPIHCNFDVFPVECGLPLIEDPLAPFEYLPSGGDQAGPIQLNVRHFPIEEGVPFDGDTDVIVPGDFDRDGDVDAFDLGIWQSGFGITPEPGFVRPDDPEWDPFNTTDTDGALFSDGDGDGDGDVDAFDLGIWQARFGTGLNATGQNVPEPGALTILVLTGLAALRRR